MIVSVSLLLLGIIGVWIGSGFAINNVSRLALRARVPSFFMSFLLLGFLTSFSEIFVGVSALIDNVPDVFVGNLLGSSVVVFFLVIPLFALLCNGITLNHTFSFSHLVLSSIVVLLPALLTLDNVITPLDGLILVVVYAFLLVVQGKDSIRHLEMLTSGRKVRNMLSLLLKTIGSVAIIFVGANLVIDQVLYLGSVLKIQPFVLSFILISIGTNIPELSIAIRSLFEKKTTIAFGNYVGSASFNTLELGLLSMIHGQKIPALGSNYAVILFAVGMFLFLIFSRSKKSISRNESLVLLLVYVGIILMELFLKGGWNLW